MLGIKRVIEKAVLHAMFRKTGKCYHTISYNDEHYMVLMGASMKSITILPPTNKPERFTGMSLDFMANTLKSFI